MKKIILVACLLGLSLPASPALPQDKAKTPATADAATPQWLLIRVAHVKPDMVNEYLDVQKNEVLPLLKKAGPPWREAWTSERNPAGKRVPVTVPIKNPAR